MRILQCLRILTPIKNYFPLIKPNPTLYWKPSPFLIRTEHGIPWLPDTLRSHLPYNAEKPSLLPSTTSQPSHNAREIQDA